MAKKPRFVLDVHLGKLARYLRMLGFDALWRDDYSDPQILEIRKRQRRIVLTRDRRLLEEHVRKGGYRVEAVYPREQLEEIVRQFR
ncbi:MAG: twitching motility protein PilT, partial [Candidatus Omnitrophica bacterium]|nr:twitching motility protein PilT [Candidatus Omnitrophota bacterium]